MTGFFSVCNRKQLPEALALGESLNIHHPEARYLIGLADRIDGIALPDNVEVIPVDQLGIPGLATISERYFDFEFVHAVRPWFGKYLLEQSEINAEWVFMAPTTMVYSPVTDVISSSADFLLSPNLTARLPESAYLDDKRILNVGMFHSNAWMARKTPEVMKFIDWWSTRTIDRAFFDLCNGMCLDQLWLNYAPVLVEKWGVNRNPNWHLGLHNALQYPISLAGRVPILSDQRVLSVDFAGIQGFHPVWSDHSQVVSHNDEWKTLISNYQEKVGKQAALQTSGIPFYGRPATISSIRNFRKSVKSELDQIVKLIETIEI